METASIDTYGDVGSKTLPSAVAEGKYDTNKYNTGIGNWDIPKDRLHGFVSGVLTDKYHVARVILDPTDKQKTLLTGDTSANHRYNNSNLTEDAKYDGIRNLDPEETHNVYMYLERNWRDIKFVANDNGLMKTSSKALIEVK